jgi:TolA-binding protein
MEHSVIGGWLNMSQPAGDVTDRSGNAILTLLQQASDSAIGAYDRVIQIAHDLAVQLRDTEDQINQLQAKVAKLEDRAVQAEHWLDRIAGEIEHKFLHS